MRQSYKVVFYWLYFTSRVELFPLQNWKKNEKDNKRISERLHAGALIQERQHDN
jgi:hypothetical protein